MHRPWFKEVSESVLTPGTWTIWPTQQRYPSCLSWGSRRNRAAERAATASPAGAKLRAAGTCGKPGVPRTRRGSFRSRRRSSRTGDELHDPLQPLLHQSISRSTWHIGSLGRCQLAPARSHPAPRVGGWQESSEANLRKILVNPVQPYSSTASTPAEAVRKALLQGKFCFVFILLVCSRICACGCDLINRSQHQFV